MNNEIIFRNNSESEKFSAKNSSLEALQILSQTLLRELESLNDYSKSDKKSVNGKIDLANEVKKFEMELIRCALVKTGGRQRRAAKLLNVKISTLNAKIKRYGIPTSGLELAV